MAEAAAVIGAIGKFIPMVADKLSPEVSPIFNFREDIEFISQKLDSIKRLLTHAGEKGNPSSDWLDSLEDFVADAEYLLEECGAADNIFAKLKLRLKMRSKIRELKKRLEQIQRDNAEILQEFASASVVNSHGPERSYAVLQEAKTVGMDGEIKVITEWILKENSPPVIAIVGMGGQGKTLLLQHIFKNEEISQRFDHKVWLAISQKFDVLVLLGQVLREFEPNFDSNKLNKGELIEKIQKNLEGKRCLFAVDDVWDRYAWEKIGLPSGTEDKVVVTTRDENVAKYLRAGDQILHKNSLTEEDSWRLFCIHAFPHDPHQCPKAVERIAHEIANKCGGLPLAIKTIGAHMAILAFEIPNDWEDTLRHLHDIDGVMPSLKFSYDALPHHLKPCFLYCSVFPKNTQIKSESLVHAWIAQGFVSAQLQEAFDVGCSYMELLIDRGYSYMQHLIDRCLLEVSEVGWNGRVNSCKMHDLLHDLAVSEQSKSKCLIAPGGQLKKMPAKECEGMRRISFMKNEISTIEKGIQCPRLRSLLLSDNRCLTSISASFFDNMRYLCVLDLSRTDITSLPNSIGNLKLLKYLNLSDTRIQKLPKSLSGLRQLQFLDVHKTRVERLHQGIEKQKHMLHLNLDWGMKYCPVGISKLIHLQTLNNVSFTLGNSGNASALQVRDLKGLTHLRHLSIFIESSNVTMEDEGTFGGMTKMRTLSVNQKCWNDRGLYLPTDMEAMQRLEIVHLYNCVAPKWIFQLQNLMELSLKGQANSSSADFRGLENIPNLKKLHLEGYSNWNKNFNEFPNEFGEAGAFPKLEELVIENFEYLRSIPSFHEDAMPKLKCLRISQCKPLENMPEGLMKLRNLKEVEVSMDVNDVGGFKNTKRHCWQSFKDRQIKIKVELWNGDFDTQRLE